MLFCLFLVPPRWMVEPTDHSVVQGNPVSLHCQVDGFPKPTIIWKQAVGIYFFIFSLSFLYLFILLYTSLSSLCSKF
jgi:hypothetical protein